MHGPIICPTDKKEMTCVKTGVACRWNNGHHVYRGDKFECPVCKAQVVITNSSSYHDDNPVIDEHDVIM